MKTIKPATELETELLAVVAELTIENRRLKVALEDSQKELVNARSLFIAISHSYIKRKFLWFAK